MSTGKYFSGDDELDALINDHVQSKETNEDVDVKNKEEQPEVNETEDTEKNEQKIKDTETTEQTDVHSNDDKEEKEKDVSESEEKEEVLEGDDITIDRFNRAFDTKFESLDDVKSLFESSNKTEELRASLESKEKEIQEKEALLEKNSNALNLFPDKEMYKVSQILINNPDLNREKVASLVYSDLDKMSDSDVLKLQKTLKLKNSGFDDATIEYAINKQYGLVDDPNELEGEELRQYKANEFLRNEAAQSAREELRKMTDVEVPERVDLLKMQEDKQNESQKAFQENLTTWTNKSKEVIDSLDKRVLDLGDYGKFEFEYDKDFKSHLAKNLPEYAARMGLDASKPESVEKVKAVIENDFRNQREQQMFKTFAETLLARKEDEEYKKKHNVKEPDVNKESPDGTTKAEQKNKESTEKVLSWLDNNKMF